MNRPLAIIAVLLGLTGVALGAFGAHGLREWVSDQRLEVWKTAVSYQMYHVPVLLWLAWIGPRPVGALLWAGRCLLAGVLVFSISLYALVALDAPWLGAVTPVGGSLLLLGWVLLLVALVNQSFRQE